MTSNLYLNKVSDVSAAGIPPTFFGTGNTDCTIVYGAKCSIDTAYGAVGDSSVWLDGQWRPIKDYGGNSSNLFAIPNSDTAITTSSPPGFGSYVYFTDNTSLALTPHYAIGSTDLGAALNYFQLNRSYDRKLADKSGNRLAADLNSMAFSGDGKWMTATDPNVANLRVNLNTGEVLPFGSKFTYGSGQNPVPKNAISSDGRYALEASNNSSTFIIYDLSTCQATPNTISRPVSCAGRELINSGYLPGAIPGYNGLLYARFLNDDTLSFYASYKDGAVMKYGLYTLSTEPAGLDRLQYLALGDSYISGEGAFDYRSGTDTDTNHCHTSLLSYPYLLGSDLSYDSYHSVACSGATTDDITNQTDSYEGQNDSNKKLVDFSISDMDGILTDFSPGYLDQLEFIKKYQPQAVTISIGGNDMGFSKILIRCLEPDNCYSSYEDRVEVVRQIDYIVFPRLLATYRQLKNASPDTRFYVIGYPQIIKADGDCGDNVHLGSQEAGFAQDLIDYLDSVIEAAANNAGLRYVDVQNALDGHRLCEAQPGGSAVNGITAGNDRLLHTIGAETYHPTSFGHRLIEQSILNATANLTQPMPQLNPASSFPLEDGLAILDAPKSNRAINLLNYDEDISNDVVYRGGVWNIAVQGITYGLLKPGSIVRAELHSDPVKLGDFTTDQNGNLNAQTTPTDNVSEGFHTLHIYGTDVANQPVDIYKVIYVAGSPESLVISADNPCVVVLPSGNDYDQDGIDDACDGIIDAAPLQTAPPAAQPGGTAPSQPDHTATNPDNPNQGQAVTVVSDSGEPAVVSESLAKPVSGLAPAQALIQNPSAGSNDSSVAAAVQFDTPGRVLAAATSKNNIDSNKNSPDGVLDDYWLTVSAIPALVGLAYIAARWVKS